MSLTRPHLIEKAYLWFQDLEQPPDDRWFEENNWLVKADSYRMRSIINYVINYDVICKPP